MLHRSAQERYTKLKKPFTRLKDNFNKDDLDDFVQTANSLREWIREDASLSPAQKAHLEQFVVPDSVDWQICNQIANQQKHFGHSNPRTKKAALQALRTIKVKAVDVTDGGPGFIVPPSMRVIGAGEEITIDWGDGKRESALGIAIRIFQRFHYIFEVAPFPPERRVFARMSDILA